ncbi:hypothetical protein GCM10027299_02870 [Larkinella ripae]
MSKLPWAKYLFSILSAAIAVALVAKFITPNVLVLVPLALGLYWLFLRGFSRLKGY